MLFYDGKLIWNGLSDLYNNKKENHDDEANTKLKKEEAVWAGLMEACSSRQKDGDEEDRDEQAREAAQEQQQLIDTMQILYNLQQEGWKAMYSYLVINTKLDKVSMKQGEEEEEEGS